jgi:hypothetical protein
MAENKGLAGTSIKQRRYIELYGVIGKFHLPNKSLKVNYFSTVANGNKKEANGYSLLKELKPMRERVKASEIKDLSSLLQRNLDDYRVAFELVPYLINQPDIAFFGAVLGVLIPKNFLSEGNSEKYPVRKDSKSPSGLRRISFEEKWYLDVFELDSKEINLGTMSIDLNDVEVVVLDGQHRANAFRVISGAFEDRDSSVYPAFYKEIINVENLDADLPITLVWFDQEKAEFDPRLVSRRLFVDVNNTAKKVSKSRRILLNDYDVPSLLTRFFYSSIAQTRSFEVDTFSLFHSEFDKDTDTNVSSNNTVAITNPEFIHEIFSWLTLGQRNYSDLTIYKSRDTLKSNIPIFATIFKAEKFSEKDIDPYGEILNSRFVVIKEPSKISDFESEYNRVLHSIICQVFSDFNFFKIHFKTCKSLEDWYKAEMNTTQRLIWEEVFLGGEGLYYTFKNKEIADKANASLKSYLMAIEEIETRFKKERTNHFNGIAENVVNSAYDSATTKAFQVGLFMALDFFRGEVSFEDRITEFVTRINTIKPESWVVILTEVRNKLISGVDPKLWPSYQNFILRIIQKDFEYYNQGNFMNAPDGIIFKGNIEEQFNAWWRNTDDIAEADLTLEVIGLESIAKWSKSAKDLIDDLIVRSGGAIIQGIDERKIGLEITKAIVDKINPTH